MTHTTEQIDLLIRIFGAYCNSGVMHPADRCAFKYRGAQAFPGVISSSLQPILYGDWSGGTHPYTAGESLCEWSDIKLILTPMEDMSDTDALMVVSITEKPDFRASELIDYLRSKSYDCGYGHIESLIDEGYAVKKSRQ